MSSKKTVGFSEAAPEIRRKPAPEELKSERVQEWLSARPDWSLSPSGRAIRLVKAFPSQQVAAQYSAFVNAFSDALSLPAVVSVAGDRVKVTLSGRRCAGHPWGLNEAVLDFAGQLG